jgi:hypothetical protein
MATETEFKLLLIVADRFQIDHLGLVLAPDFSVPGGSWADQTHSVMIETPEGGRFDAEAVFGLSHFNIRDPNVSIDRRWRVTVRIPQVLKEQVPIGSKMYASPHLVATLRNEDA